MMMMVLSCFSFLEGSAYIQMSELEEVRNLISIATYPNLRKILQDYEASLIPVPPAPVMESVAAPAVEMCVEETRTPPPAPASAAIKTASVRQAASKSSGDVLYTPITDFAWDQGGYNSDTVTIYVELQDVVSVKDNVDCKFTQSSFDLTVCTTQSFGHVIYI